jgi:plasmid maintenance system antidote protein VapI
MGAGQLRQRRRFASDAILARRLSFWMNLQALYDLAIAQEDAGAAIAHDVRPLQPA